MSCFFSRLIQNDIEVGDILDELFEKSLRNIIRGTVEIVIKFIILIFKLFRVAES